MTLNQSIHLYLAPFSFAIRSNQNNYVQHLSCRSQNGRYYNYAALCVFPATGGKNDWRHPVIFIQLQLIALMRCGIERCLYMVWLVIDHSYARGNITGPFNCFAQHQYYYAGRYADDLPGGIPVQTAQTI